MSTHACPPQTVAVPVASSVKAAEAIDQHLASTARGAMIPVGPCVLIASAGPNDLPVDGSRGLEQHIAAASVAPTGCRTFGCRRGSSVQSCCDGGQEQQQPHGVPCKCGRDALVWRSR